MTRDASAIQLIPKRRFTTKTPRHQDHKDLVSWCLGGTQNKTIANNRLSYRQPCQRTQEQVSAPPTRYLSRITYSVSPVCVASSPSTVAPMVGRLAQPSRYTPWSSLRAPAPLVL